MDPPPARPPPRPLPGLAALLEGTGPAARAQPSLPPPPLDVASFYSPPAWAYDPAAAALSPAMAALAAVRTGHAHALRPVPTAVEIDAVRNGAVVDTYELFPSLPPAGAPLGSVGLPQTSASAVPTAAAATGGSERPTAACASRSFWILGKDPASCDIPAEHPTASRRHAVLQLGWHAAAVPTAEAADAPAVLPSPEQRSPSKAAGQRRAFAAPEPSSVLSFVHLYDVGSANGTFLCGHGGAAAAAAAVPVPPRCHVPLTNGATFRVAGSTRVFRVRVTEGHAAVGGGAAGVLRTAGGADGAPPSPPSPARGGLGDNARKRPRTDGDDDDDIDAAAAAAAAAAGRAGPNAVRVSYSGFLAHQRDSGNGVDGGADGGDADSGVLAGGDFDSGDVLYDRTVDGSGGDGGGPGATYARCGPATLAAVAARLRAAIAAERGGGSVTAGGALAPASRRTMDLSRELDAVEARLLRLREAAKAGASALLPGGGGDHHTLGVPGSLPGDGAAARWGARLGAARRPVTTTVVVKAVEARPNLAGDGK